MRIGLAIALVLTTAVAAGASTLPASVKLADCSRDQRSASFHGRMKGIEGSERMGMRFTLLEKRGLRFAAISAPGLGRWHRSRPAVEAFGWRQTVRGLQAGASYRMQVSFRWYDAEGELLDSTRRRSAVCRQFAELPNLTATLERVRRTQVDGVLHYLIRVDNTGVAAAEDAALRLTVDGGVVDTATIAEILPGESELVGYRGPECETSVIAIADPDGRLSESIETDNVEQTPCADLPLG